MMAQKSNLDVEKKIKEAVKDIDTVRVELRYAHSDFPAIGISSWDENWEYCECFIDEKNSLNSNVQRILQWAKECNVI